MNAVTRRTFVKSSFAASAAFSVLPGGRAASPNEKILIGVMGLGGRGLYLAQAFAKRKDAEVAWLCDPDSRRFDGARKRQRALPPVEAVAPATGLGKAGEFLLRATLHAPTNGLYRLDWRSNAPPPTVKVNGKECALDPRRFSSPAQSGERPRRFCVMLNVGDNEVVWRGRYAPGQWMAPVLMGVELPK
ncbi:MAG: hypothetical protein AAB676_21500 [Verrucomicrobiota bacterium]